MTANVPDAEVASQLGEMLAELRALCPSLCPSVMPAGCDDRSRGTALAALCGPDASERAALAEVLERARRGRSACALTGRAVPEEQLRFVSFWDVEPAHAELRLRGVGFVCVEAALLLDPLLTLERFANVDGESSELRELSLLFCTANGREDLCAKPARALEWMQQCYSLAYACRVVACGLRTDWSLRDAEGSPLAQPDRVAAGLLRLAQPAQKKSPGVKRERQSSAAPSLKLERESPAPAKKRREESGDSQGAQKRAPLPESVATPDRARGAGVRVGAAGKRRKSS